MSTYLIKLACELPDTVGRSLNYWTCFELAQTLIRDNIVTGISAQTVQRILEGEKLKPWRVHYWLSAKVPYDEHFRSIVLDICDLYTRKPDPSERILSLDELTSIQPRTRASKTKPAQKSKPVLIEHEYERKGAWNLFAPIRYSNRKGNRNRKKAQRSIGIHLAARISKN